MYLNGDQVSRSDQRCQAELDESQSTASIEALLVALTQPG